MGAPTPERHQETIGRSGRVMWRCAWDDINNTDNLSNEVVAAQDELPTTEYGEFVRFGVKKIRWVASANVSAQVYFNSTPASTEGLILAITPDSTTGERDFSGFPSGCLPDPNPEAPADIVVDTDNSLIDDDLFLELELKIKGTRSSNG